MRTLQKMAILGLLAPAFMIAACSPAGETADPPKTADSTGGSTSPGTASTATDIKFQLYQKPTSFSPFHSTHGADLQIIALQFLPPLTYADGDFVPRLAKSWESDDAQNYTLVLEDAKWSDGEAITADDFAYTLNTHADPKTASVTAGPLNVIEGFAAVADGSATELSGVTVKDEKTLEIKLAKPSLAFLAALTELFILPEHIYGEIPNDQLMGNELFREPTVGSGAYMFSNWVSDDNIEYVANENALYKAQLPKLYAKYLAGDVAIAQLQTGEVDIAEVPVAEASTLADEGMTIVSNEGNKVMTLWSALSSGKLEDKRVRQAIMYAIDRQAIIDSVLGGEGRTVDTVMFQPDWAQNADAPDYSYDPEKAKALLAEAKWDPSKEVHLDIIPGQPDRDAVFNIVVGQLKDAGINAVIKQHQPAELTELVNSGGIDLLISPLTMPVPEPATLNVRWLCDQAKPGGINITRYCNPELDKLLLQGASETDQSKRPATYQEINAILAEEMPNFPLYVANLTSGTTETVTGFDNRVWPSTVIADRWTK